MIYEKQLPVPAPARNVLHIPLSRLRAGDLVRELYLVHVKEGDSGLECAEGLTRYPVDCPKYTVDVYASVDEVFAMYTDPTGSVNYLYGFANHRDYKDMITKPLNWIAPISMQRNYGLPQTWYMVTDDKTWKCCVFSNSSDFSNGQGGIYGAEYAGRFFLLDYRKIIFTAPYDESKWVFKKDGTLNGYNTMDIAPRCGDYVGGACFKDKLFLFAQYGVVEVTMGGKSLNGKTRYLFHDFGATLRGTIQQVGDRALFFTDRGLCSFDGEKFERLVTPCAAQIDFSAAVKSGTSRGKYYAFVALKGGDRRVYVYDPEHRRETFLGVDVDKFAAGWKVVALKDGIFYEFADHVLPETGEPCRICCKLAPKAGETARIDWVFVEGRGNFTVEASTPNDGCTLASGRANAKLYLHRSLFGSELCLTISTTDTDFRVTGISVGMGEGTDDD